MSWSETVAQAVLRSFTTPEPPSKSIQPVLKESTIDPVTIMALISAVLPLVQKCRADKKTDDELLSSARGAQGVFAIRRAARANGLIGRRFRTTVRQAVSELKTMTDDELLEQVINAPEMEKDEDGNDGIDYDLFN